MERGKDSEAQYVVFPIQKPSSPSRGPRCFNNREMDTESQRYNCSSNCRENAAMLACSDDGQW